MILTRKPRVFAIISIIVSTQLWANQANAGVNTFDRVYVLVGAELLKVELAQSELEKSIGLSNRKLNANNSYMMFMYSQPQQVTFWMKNTKKDLSIAFIDPNNRIIQIENLKARSERILESKSSQVKYAFEVPKGFFGMHDIKIGDEVIVFK